MDLIPENVAPLAPMIRGHQYMDMFERDGTLDLVFIKYIILISKTTNDMSIGVYGNTEDMDVQYKKAIEEMDEYNLRAHKLTFEDYPELWI